MKKVKMIASRAGFLPDGDVFSHAPGQVVELTEAEADALIANGDATPAPDEEPGPKKKK